jgi:hypothetical protein
MWVSGQRHAPAAQRDRTHSTHYTGSWVDPRAGLDREAREKSFASAGDRISIVQSVVRHYIEFPRLHVNPQTLTTVYKVVLESNTA